MKQMGRKLMGLAMSLVLLAVLLPGTAKAESVPPTGPAGLDLTGEDAKKSMTYAYGEGTAEWVYSSDPSTTPHTLTLSGDGEIINATEGFGIFLPAGSKLVVAENAHWTVKGADGASAGYDGIRVNGDLTLEVKGNASLDTAGGTCSNTYTGGHGLYAGGELTAEVEETGSLTATGGDSQKFSGTGIACDLLHLANNGTVKASAGKANGAYSSIGLKSYSGDGVSTISGTGRLLCMGLTGITVQKKVSGLAGALEITSGTVIAVGQSSYGAETLTGTVTVKSGAALTAVGAQNGIEGSVLGDGTVFQLTAALGADFGPEDIVTEDKSTGLDLSEVKKSKLYTNVGGGTALWEYSSEPGTTPHTLTLSGDGKIEAEGDNKGITLPAGSQLVVAENAHWTVKGADSESAGYHGIYADGDLELEIKQNASLDLAGGNSNDTFFGGYFGGHGLYVKGALTAEVAKSGSLTAVGGDSSVTGGYGIWSGLLHLTNNGTVRAASGKTKDAYSSIGLWSYCGDGFSTISGTGRLLCMGDLGITVQKEESGHSGALKIKGGTVIAVGQSLSGVYMFGGMVTVESGASLTAVGAELGINGAVSGGGKVFQFTAALDADFGPEDVVTDYQSEELDLTGVTKTTLYTNVRGGMALWEPGQTSNLLTLNGAGLSGGLGGLLLPAGENEIALLGENIMESGITLAEGNSNSLTLSGSGSLKLRKLTPEAIAVKPLIGTDSIIIAAPEPGWYATAVAGANGSDARGIPGSVFREGTGGYYTLRNSDRYFELNYRQKSGVSELLLTVEGGFGGGVYGQGTNTPIEYEGGNPYVTFRKWELAEGDGTIKNPGRASTSFTMGTEDAVVKALVDEGGPKPNPGPTLETGEHRVYLHGYEDGTLRPNGTLTREEAAMIFYNLLDEASREKYETEECPFSDLRAGSWSYKAVCTLANAGLLKGDSGGLCRPGDPVTRAEYVTILTRFEPGTYEGEDLFPDIGKHWARGNINYAASKGWIEGYEDGTFRPDEKITRAEAAAVLNRALLRLPESEDDLLPGRKVFPDNTDPKQWYYLILEEAANPHEYQRKSDGIHESWTELK